MKMKKILLAAVSVFCTIFLFTLSSSNRVQALDNITPRALETYTKEATIACGPIGTTRVKLYITHNMTTGNSWISSYTHTDTVYAMYPLADIESVKIDPGVNEYFTGKISIKVTVYWTNVGQDFTTVHYMNS